LALVNYVQTQLKLVTELILADTYDVIRLPRSLVHTILPRHQRWYGVRSSWIRQ